MIPACCSCSLGLLVGLASLSIRLWSVSTYAPSLTVVHRHAVAGCADASLQQSLYGHIAGDLKAAGRTRDGEGASGGCEPCSMPFVR